MVRDWGQSTPDAELVTLPQGACRATGEWRGCSASSPRPAVPHCPGSSPAGRATLPARPLRVRHRPTHRAGPAPSRAERPRSERADWLPPSGAGPGALKRPVRSRARREVVLLELSHALHQVQACRRYPPALLCPSPPHPLCLPRLLGFSASSCVRERLWRSPLRRCCSWDSTASCGLAPASPG